MWFATIADGLVDEIADGLNTGTDEHVVTDKDSNNKRQLKNKHQLKTLLLDTFGEWHSPIRDLLQATDANDILQDDARAMSARGLRLTAAIASGGCRSGGSDGEWVRRSVLVGDAAHTVRTRLF